MSNSWIYRWQELSWFDPVTCTESYQGNVSFPFEIGDFELISLSSRLQLYGATTFVNKEVNRLQHLCLQRHGQSTYQGDWTHSVITLTKSAVKFVNRYARSSAGSSRASKCKKFLLNCCKNQSYNGESSIVKHLSLFLIIYCLLYCDNRHNGFQTEKVGLTVPTHC